MIYNWRAAIGVIAPTTGVAIEMDFHRFAPEGVAVVTNRIPFSGNPTPEELMDMVSYLEESARIFRPEVPFDVVTFGCTSGSLVGGSGFDKKCIEAIEKTCGFPGLTTSTSLLDAFKALGAGNAAVVTPYPDETNVLEKKFLEDNGVHVTNIKGMTSKRCSLDELSDRPHDIYQHVKNLDLTGADSIFISCTGMNVLDIISTIESDFGLPVLTSNQVTLWGALRKARVGDKIPYLGKLFTI
ncbi:aspartate/glutamate racemase family protein [Lachnoclostridium pacaense]|uniref:maleate cis-trans isomerase family protein n=1 Tax=Enterocloster hominis (ex Hitch et al. 2024) TaxID=1917870 RepID=UPI001D10B9A7|nr:aspartate/glutamate racemase family protein [Lachnoclostridium pacaense]MCC2874983.1 aspartate/glutamate racemase family protein [Lachnoclostridium pacaense]